MHLIFFLQPAQDRDRILDSRLGDEDRLKPARRDGLAVGAGRPTREDALTSALLGAGLVLLFLGPAAGAATVIAAAAAAAFMAAQARRQVGGSTGDVLGAVQQVGETAALLAAALVAP